jgi:hypothetical protein
MLEQNESTASSKAVDLPLTSDHLEEFQKIVGDFLQKNLKSEDISSITIEIKYNPVLSSSAPVDCEERVFAVKSLPSERTLARFGCIPGGEVDAKCAFMGGHYGQLP